jgi:hypothetical protein
MPRTVRLPGCIGQRGAIDLHPIEAKSLGRTTRSLKVKLLTGYVILALIPLAGLTWYNVIGQIAAANSDQARNGLTMLAVAGVAVGLVTTRFSEYRKADSEAAGRG